MRIVIASGKGGAGKTTLTASLHAVWPRPHALADTDVEAPNLHLFLHPVTLRTAEVELSVPVKVGLSCSVCGTCRDICHFGAIARFGKKITLFPEMCHGCGGCFAVCKENALTEGKRSLGTVEIGSLSDGTPYFSGSTRIGEVMTPPVLRRLLSELEKEIPDSTDVLMDSPPGVSCPAVTVARKADAVLLVADPTPFGFADFKIAEESFSMLDLPLAVVVNRGGMPGNEGGDERIARYCEKHGLPLLGTVPFSSEAARTIAQGGMLTDMGTEWRGIITDIARSMLHCFKEKAHA